jgi:hypothetical protein
MSSEVIFFNLNNKDHSVTLNFSSGYNKQVKKELHTGKVSIKLFSLHKSNQRKGP